MQGEASNMRMESNAAVRPWQPDVPMRWPESRHRPNEERPEWNTAPAVAAPSGGESINWHRIFEILQKHWKLSLTFAVVTFVSTAAVTFALRPIYEPQARLEVDPPGAEVFSLQGTSNGQSSTDYMETQAQNLQSDALALQVIRKLRLDRSPYFGADPNATLSKPSAVDEIAMPDTAAEVRALKILKLSRHVMRDSTSRLITVSVAAPDPQVAATVTNTLVTMFIERDYQLRNTAIAQSTSWLKLQLEDIRQRMLEAQAALAKFASQHGMSVIGDSQSRYAEEMTELSRQTIQARADRIQLGSYLGHLNSGNGPEVLPQVSASPVVQELAKRLADLKGQMAETRVIYGPNHPNTVKLQSAVDELQAQMEQQKKQIEQDIRSSYAAAESREHSMQSQADAASNRMIILAEYEELKKDADTKTQLYDALYQKVKEAAIAAETKSSNIRVIDEARVLDHPTRPRRGQNLALGLGLGLFGGIIVAFLREGIETRIHTLDDLKRSIGEVSSSAVPMLKGEVVSARRSTLSLKNPQKLPSVGKPFQIAQPNSPEAEALRNISVSLRLPRVGHHGRQVFLIVSPFSGEGKTTIAVNLAVTLANHGKTCIVDADLRKECVAATLGVTAGKGIREILKKKISLDDALVPAAAAPNLFLLAPGRGSEEAGEIVGSLGMAQMIEKLRERFDFIVIDLPPILLFSDARALAPMADTVVLVARSGVTKITSLKSSMEILQQVHSGAAINVVLNGAPIAEGLYTAYGRYSVAS